MENELSNWCQIDGHDWIELSFGYQMILYSTKPKIVSKCSKCQETETKIYESVSNNIIFPFLF